MVDSSVFDRAASMSRGKRRAAVIALMAVPGTVGAQAKPVQPRAVTYPITATAPARWTVGTRPLLEIGGADGIGPTELTKITGVTRQVDGTIVVANGETGELRFFDTRGRFVRATAGRGGGPGELEYLTRMFAVDDTLLVVDGRIKAHVYAPNGKWMRSLVLPAIPGYLRNPGVGALGPFDVVLPLRGGGSDERRFDPRRNDKIRMDSIWFGRVSVRDSSARVLLGQPWAPSFALAPGRPAAYAVGFAPRTLIAATRDRICTGYPERYEVLCTDTIGRHTLRIVRDTPRRAVTDSARRVYRDNQAGRRSDGTSRFAGDLRKHRERVAAATQFAHYFPAYSELLFARTGELWVRAFAPADGMLSRPTPYYTQAGRSTWSIYGRDGKWLADCTLPARFGLAEVGADYVIGISFDEDDVERVTLLSLRR